MRRPPRKRGGGPGWGLLLAILLAGTPAAAQSPITYLNQAWSPADRAAFYWTSQGSALLSRDLYLALETADGSGPFNGPANSDRLGLLTDTPDAVANPDALPIGLARTSIATGRFAGDWVGLTCAACHTGEITHRGRRIRIDGGPATRFDFMAWIGALDAALQATLADPAKQARLLARMTAPDAPQRLARDAAFLRHYVSRTAAVVAPPGPGRMDALGLIHNLLVADRLGIPENWRPARAPVKPPFLWNAPQSAQVQWSGVMANPLVRNFGQSLGVFVQLDLTEAGGFESTADLRAQHALERLLGRLAPPSWPAEILGPLDPEKVRRGAALFAWHCQECHAAWPYRWSAPRADGRHYIENALVPLGIVGTDASQLDGITFDTRPGVLAGRFAARLGAPVVPSGALTGLLTHELLEAALRRQGLTDPVLLREMGNGLLPGERPAGPRRHYRASPRDGAWATAPFLHNGSVPNLYELLLPAAQRSRRFHLNRSFDPVRVGLDTADTSGVVFDTTLPGNSNAGHSFENTPGRGVIGRLLSEPERLALLEYLKSIPEIAGRVTPHGGPPDPALAARDRSFFNTRHPWD